MLLGAPCESVMKWGSFRCGQGVPYSILQDFCGWRRNMNLGLVLDSKSWFFLHRQRQHLLGLSFAVMMQGAQA